MSEQNKKYVWSNSEEYRESDKRSGNRRAGDKRGYGKSSQKNPQKSSYSQKKAYDRQARGNKKVYDKKPVDKKAFNKKTADAKNGDKRYGDKKAVEKKTSDAKHVEMSTVNAGNADKCPVSKKCGGCMFQGMEYKKQLEKKQGHVIHLLKEFGTVQDIIGMENPYHYRNKVHAAFDRLKDGTIVSGVYEEKSHRVIPVETCQIENELADAIMASIRDLCKSFKIRIYNEDTGYGLLRHVMVRTGYESGQVMVVLVVADPIFPSKNNFVKALRKLHPEISTVVLNINDKDTSMVLGERDIVLYGKGFIEDSLCGCTFRISPQSFYQVNPQQTEVLYNKAIELAELTGNERVIDAYCGTGTIGIIASKHAKEVIGVELNKNAVKDAVINAKRNNVKNIKFYNQDAGKFMVGMANDGDTADVVIMDPPRSGSDEAFLSSVVKLGPKKVVYISCNPETMARDLKYLQSNGYRGGEIYPVDMFPFTGHCECVMLLAKVK